MKARETSRGGRGSDGMLPRESCEFLRLENAIFTTLLG